MPTITEGVRLELETDGERTAIRNLEAVQESAQDVGTAADRASEILEKVGTAADRGSDGLRRASEASEDAERSLRQTAAAADAAGEEIRTAGGGAGGLAVNLSQIAADAPFGILGVANNIEGLSQSFSRAKAQTGSFTGVLAQLASPGNLLTIATGLVSGLAVAFGDDLVSALTDAGDKAEETDKRLKDLRGTVNDILQIGEGSTQEFEITNLAAAQTAVEQNRENLRIDESRLENARRLQELRESVTDQQRRLARLDPSGVSDPDRQLEILEAQKEVEELRQLEQLSFGDRDNLQPVITALQQRVDQQRAIDQVIGSQVEKRTRELRLSQRLRDLQGVRVKQEQDINDEQEERLRRAIELQRLQGLEGFGRSEFLTRRQAAEQQLQEDVSELDIVTPDYIESAEEAGEIADEQINQQIAQGIRLASQLGATLVQAFQKGEVEANKLFGQVLQIVGSAVAIANPAAGAAVSGIGSIIGSFASGGYTGSGPASRPAGIVHAGEYVMPKSAVEAAGGPAVFEQMQKMLTGSMSKSDLRRVAGMPPGYQSGGLVRAMTRPATGGGQSSSEMVSELRRQGEELSRLRRDLQRFADRPNLVRVDRRASRDIVETGEEERDRRTRGSQT